MAESSSEDLDQDLPWAGLYQLFILNGEGVVRFIEDGHLEGLWKSRSHSDGWFDLDGQLVQSWMGKMKEEGQGLGSLFTNWRVLI